VLVGEAGVGKRALARAAQQRVHPTASVTIIDSADCPEFGIDEWAAPLRNPESEPNRAVAVLHLDRLSAAAGAELAELLDAARDNEPLPWIVGTLDADTVAGPELDLVLQEFDTSITVPPLRHRIMDVHDLVPALLERHAPNTGVECDPDVMQTLLRRDWLGNVAELEDVLRAALARRRVGQIRLEDLPEELHAMSPRVLTRWEALERDAIVRALIEAEGNRTEAAARLSISRATIYRKIHAYGIVIEGHEK
jgi:hypothetical protein